VFIAHGFSKVPVEPAKLLVTMPHNSCALVVTARVRKIVINSLRSIIRLEYDILKNPNNTDLSDKFPTNLCFSKYLFTKFNYLIQ
jgi:hypothetical protein